MDLVDVRPAVLRLDKALPDDSRAEETHAARDGRRDTRGVPAHRVRLACEVPADREAAGAEGRERHAPDPGGSIRGPAFVAYEGA